MIYQDITVIIASFHSGDKIFDCIKSIDKDVKIIVVENSNDENSTDYINKSIEYKNIDESPDIIIKYDKLKEILEKKSNRNNSMKVDKLLSNHNIYSNCIIKKDELIKLINELLLS